KEKNMKADWIIKIAKIFTADKNNPRATALAIKDGKFVYVGDETGISEYEGEATDLRGKFIMPGIFDTHVHITTGVAFEFADLGEEVTANNKKEALEFMADYVSKNPGLNPYRFMLPRAALNGEELVKEDLDAFCPDSELVILEEECHSVWVNSKMLESHGITDDTPDPVPELAYFVRKDGHITGNAFEATSWPFLFDQLRKDLTEEQIGEAVSRWIDFSEKYGVSAVFDAGFPEHNDIHERIYAYMRELDRQGKLPVYVDGCYMLTNPRKVKEALEETKRFNREFTTEHMKVHTLKIIMDGTLKIETAAMVTPYEDTGKVGGTPFNAEEIADILKELNAAGLDLHVHCVGERSSRIILDGVELARKELGDSFKVKVTITHMWIQDDADLGRFAKLGVIANYTPAWHNGNMGLGCEPSEFWPDLIGEDRSKKMFRSKTVWDSGALVTWSSDDVNFDDFASWNPYYGMEVGMTRWINEKTKSPEGQSTKKPLEPASEKMSIEEMILGYTINGAIQLGVEDKKGSIAVGKDADFLVFDNDLLTAEQEGFSHNKPGEVYFGGKKMK
ncbi:MAG: amidohydrolase family protein, partial [Lachnospiraceae bacterium]|nr:amidohydrolase family protein [Lachnospiraceae bacterium]